MKETKKIYLLVIATILFLCLAFFGLGLFLGFSLTKSITFVLYFWLFSGSLAVVWIVGNVIYNKLYETKHGEEIITIAFIVFIIAFCVLSGLVK